MKHMPTKKMNIKELAAGDIFILGGDKYTAQKITVEYTKWSESIIRVYYTQKDSVPTHTVFFSQHKIYMKKLAA